VTNTDGEQRLHVPTSLDNEGLTIVLLVSSCVKRTGSKKVLTHNK